ncbi:hypothetical protein NQ317_007603 [Molorchus minor]|uniref:Uncharacterized protein n=1 Tax=Molorchus minor TaxID=1323400 RepID=A0ABQ9JQG8_9CUCU|nr:hypothetical protein NQ317_007603 [Molorchus minor]
MDMVNYLILTHSFYTGQQLKAYKSLQVYKYYEARFVKEVLAKKVHENAFVVVDKPQPAAVQVAIAGNGGTTLEKI